jgi:hypothetical protein
MRQMIEMKSAEFVTLQINKILTFKEEDIAILREIEAFFQDPPRSCFNWNGHMFTGKLKNTVNGDIFTKTTAK